jgi:phage terminase small subunit
MLALYAETVELYLRFKSDIDTHGTLVTGRSAQEQVRNPSLMGLSQCRADLIRLSKAVPLVSNKADAAGAELDHFIEEIMK